METLSVIYAAVLDVDPLWRVGKCLVLGEVGTGQAVPELTLGAGLSLTQVNDILDVVTKSGTWQTLVHITTSPRNQHPRRLSLTIPLGTQSFEFH
ncbi:Hypothetical predicted protein [Marmota monax]|uniref:Uncharacterized protein n=1 Tax=Marmota monax TaxID=9995 RepID=A0A5E4CTH8_MARMO|nr:Hypothetical predicted protein [Marmota monax]